MKDPIERHFEIFAGGIILTFVSLFIIIFICAAYEAFLANIMPTGITWIIEFIIKYVSVWPFIGSAITLIKSIIFIIKNILPADLSNYKLISKELYFIAVIIESIFFIICIYMTCIQIYDITIEI